MAEKKYLDYSGLQQYHQLIQEHLPSNKQGVNNGSELSLVTTGEKYTWNNKQDTIVFNTAYNASSNKAATMADIPNTIRPGELIHIVTNVTGTAAVTTNLYNAAVWSGTCDGVTSLYTGLTVNIKIPVAGNGTYGTVLDINELGGHPVVRNVSTAISTAFAVGCILTMVYDADQTATAYFNSNSATTVTGCWKVYDYDSTINYQLRHNYGPYISNGSLYRYQLLLQKNETTLIPVNEVDNGPNNTSKPITTESFNPFGSIFYYNSTTGINTDGAIAGSTLMQQVHLDLRYSFNITTTSLTLNKDIYIVAVPQSDGLAKLDVITPITQELPSTEDGKIYIYLGHSYSGYQIEMYPVHPIYQYKNGKIQLYTGDTQSSLTLGETSSTAYAGDKGKALADKLDGIESGAQAHIAPTASEVKNALGTGSGTTKYLREDGTWQIPPDHTYTVATTSEAGLMSADDKIKLGGIANGATKVTTDTVSVWGYTKNTGTITGINMNGASKGTSGVVDLGTVITSHQDISGKVDNTTTVNGHALSSDITITKSDIGLDNVGNFKAVSTVASQELTDTEKSNARANIGAGTSSFSGSYNDLTDKPTIPDAQIQADWNQTTTTAKDFIKNKPTIPAAQVNADWNASSGVAQILNKPTIPSAANNGTFSVKTKVGSATAVTAADFTANQSTADDITFVQGENITLTTDTTNRTITIASNGAPVTSVAGKTGVVTLDYSDIGYTVHAPSATSGSITINYNNGPIQVITLSGNASSVSTSNIPAGHSCHIIFVSDSSSTERTVAIAHNSSTSCCPAGEALSLTVPGQGSGYTEVDFINVNNIIYVRGV